MIAAARERAVESNNRDRVAGATGWKCRRETLAEPRESKARWQSRLIVNKCNLITWQLATTHGIIQRTRRKRRRRRRTAAKRKMPKEGQSAVEEEGVRGRRKRRKSKTNVKGKGRKESRDILRRCCISLNSISSFFCTTGRIRQGQAARRRSKMEFFSRPQRRDEEMTRDKTRESYLVSLYSHVRFFNSISNCPCISKSKF